MNRRQLIAVGMLALLGVIAGQLVVIINLLQRSQIAVLECTATNAGVPLGSDDARAYVYRAGRHDVVAAKGRLDHAMMVPPGRYDVRIIFDSRDHQTVWVEDLPIAAGETKTIDVRSEVGNLVIEGHVGSRAARRENVTAYIFSPGNHDDLITSLMSGEAGALGSGTYDIRVVWTEGSLEKEVVWLEDVRVQSGKTTTKSVVFQRGMLLVEAVNDGEPLPLGAVHLRVSRSGDDQLEIIDAGIAGEPLGLEVGRYDVEVVFSHSDDRPAKWLRDVEIRVDQTVQHLVEFSSGQLKVDAQIAEGELRPFEVYIYYYRAGDHRQPVSYTPAGDTAVLTSGQYDVRAHFFRSHDQPDIWLRDISLKAGETVEKLVVFPSGRLYVRVIDQSGEEVIGENTAIGLHAVGERSLPVAKARAGERITVTAGEYDIHIEDTRRPGAGIWKAEVPVVAGKQTDVVVTLE